MGQSRHVHSTDRLLEVLTYIANQPVPLTARDVAADLDQPISTIYRYLSSLREWGFVCETAVPGKYGIGPRCMQLSANFRNNFDLVAIAHPEMAKLADQTQETVALVVPMGVQVVCVETVESLHSVRYSFSKGAVRPLLRGASAKAMLPYLHENIITKAVQDSEDMTREHEDQLWRDIAEIRHNGYSVSEGEVDPDAWAVGVPIFDDLGVVEGSISVIAPVFRASSRRRDEIVQRALAATTRIEESFGWKGDSHAI